MAALSWVVGLTRPHGSLHISADNLDAVEHPYVHSYHRHGGLKQGMPDDEDMFESEDPPRFIFISYISAVNGMWNKNNRGRGILMTLP